MPENKFAASSLGSKLKFLIMKIEEKEGGGVWPQEKRKTRRKDPSRGKEVCGRKGRPAKEKY